MGWNRVDPDSRPLATTSLNPPPEDLKPRTLHLFVIAPSPPTTPKIQHSFPPPPPPLPSPSVFPIPHRNLVCSLILFSFFSFFSFSLFSHLQRRPLRRVHSLVLLPLLCLSFSLCERPRQLALFSYNTFLLLAYLPFAEFRRLQFV
ncbi:hypothetical protein B9Z19DRAFT_156740 [Tuber borchii]|uniref:Uncharacterized protein n=1 Tax=Tuber borchii TaxID=42251 RepID=A0A2T6ZQ11_TUBBO|nr:hypothetical protein B9Z19DRAFT_156740 [Tuber borchii]